MRGLIHNIKLLYCTLFLILIVTNLGCKKIVDVGLPPAQVLDKTVFSTDALAQASVRGLYSFERMQMFSTTFYITNGGVTVYAGLSADELSYSGTDVNYPTFEANQVSPSSSVINHYLWTWSYQLIYHANACLKGLEQSSTLSPSVKSALIGECLFFRSFFYFYLTNLFGDVPYIAGTDYIENSVTGRTPVSEIYKGLVDDLEQARSLMTEVYPDGTNSRPNKWAATALLARIYLYLQQWQSAEQLSSEIIDSQDYTLLNDLNSVYLNNSEEALWQVLTSNASSSFIGEGYVFTNGITANLHLTDSLVNAFEPADARWTNWVIPKSVGSEIYYKPNKYKNNRSVTIGEESYMMLRYAELYLIRAEARAHQLKTSLALEDLDVLRSRAGLPLYIDTEPEPTEDELLRFIEQERRIELFCEWGHRWLDLKRSPGVINEAVTRADELLAPMKENWQSSHLLFPIPDVQISLNQQLKQNNGY